MTSAGVALIDGSLVARSQAGDPEAIGELAAQVRPMVQRYASRFFSDPARAEDMAQTALMKAFSRVGDVRSPAAFQAWLLRIARNECLNELARQKHAQLPLSTLADGGAEIEAPAGGDDDPEEALLRSQLQGLVRRVAATLPPHYRQALTMRALEDRTYEEISEALDIPVPVARLWYCRARKRFRSAFVTTMVARRNVPALCQEMGEAITEMIEGTLPAADRSRVEEHVGGCQVCRQTEDELRNTAFRAPSRALLLGLGLLRLGWRLPRHVAHGLVRGPGLLGRLALSGAGGAAMATAVVGSPMLALPTPVAEGAHGHVQLGSLPAPRPGGVILTGDRVPGGTAAGGTAPVLAGLAGLADLGDTGDLSLTLMIQRLDGIAPAGIRLDALQLGPRARAALARQVEAARGTAAATLDDLAAQQQRAQQQQQHPSHQPAVPGSPPGGASPANPNPTAGAGPGTAGGGPAPAGGAPATPAGAAPQGGAQSGSGSPTSLH
jgi:RNA polymerase sigma-70 factor, ECF subfamily